MSTASAHPSDLRTGKETREVLLRAAAREIHVRGFQAASLSRILAETGVTKGALYHHFPSKLALGYAVLDEHYAPGLRQHWIQPLAGEPSDPLQVLIDIIREAGHGMTKSDVLLGCPLNNLAQEMSPVDEGFRLRIEALFDEWRSVIESALRRAHQSGTLSEEIDAQASAAFIVAALEGCIGMAKNAQSREVLLSCGEGLVCYLQSLRDGVCRKARVNR